MIGRRWLSFLITAFLIGALLGLRPLVVLVSMLLVVMGVAAWWRDRALTGVKYHRLPYYRRAFPGETVPVVIEIRNDKYLPLTWLQVSDPWPQAVSPMVEGLLAASHIPEVGILTHLFSLRWYATVRRRYHLLFRERGVYLIGPAQLASGDVFGLFESRREQSTTTRLTVFPRRLPLEALHLPTEDPFGDIRSERRLYEDPNLPMGVREYLPGDDFRRVHWPATARTGQLQTRVYQPVSARVIVVCLNIATFARHWEGTYPPLLEHLISAAAALVSRAVEDGYQVGLISNGCLANSDQPFRIRPGRSPGQLASLLEALAAVTPITTSSFDRFLMREVPGLPYGAPLMVLTGVHTPEISEAMLRLKKHGRRITLLSFAPDPPEAIPGIKVFHSPFQEGAPEGVADGHA